MEEQQVPKTILLRPFSEIFGSSVKRHRERKGVPDIPINCFPTLNKMMFGFTRGHVVVIGGRTSQGKTSLALQLAIDAALQGYNVRYLSLEQDEEELADRIFCNVTRTSYFPYRADPMAYQDQLLDFYKFANDKLKTLILAYRVGSTIGEVTGLVQDLQADMVIVDYVQAVKKLGTDKLDALNSYIIRFREAAVTNRFVGILVSQINRGAEETKGSVPNIWQLKGSGTIEEHADSVLLCHYPHFYSHKDDDRTHFKLIVAKQRQGYCGDINMDFSADMYSFAENKNPRWVRDDNPDPEAKRKADLFGGTVYKQEDPDGTEHQDPV